MGGMRAGPHATSHDLVPAGEVEVRCGEHDHATHMGMTAFLPLASLRFAAALRGAP